MLLAVILLSSSVVAQQPARVHSINSGESRAARKLDAVRNDPLALRAFLLQFPKGGDLHNHLSGAVYAESYIQWAAEDGMCVDTATHALASAASAKGEQSTCAPGQRPASDALKDPALYRDLIDSFSMRNHSAALEANEYQFFSTFAKFGAVARAEQGREIAEVMLRAAEQNELYLELIGNWDGNVSVGISNAVPLNLDDFAATQKQLESAGIADSAKAARRNLDTDETAARAALHCDASPQPPACKVQVRYIWEVYRAGTPAHVFAQLLAGFMAASQDPRIVAINLVQPEDWYVPLHDYALHMKMIAYLHTQFPQVHITLHAGELTFGQVPPRELGWHIGSAIHDGHAQRIGHGVDVMYAADPGSLLREMAKQKIAVEICLTSNEVILGVKGNEQPFMQYLDAGVPLVISTDDEGVSRSDLTHEYQVAVERYHLSYAQLKRLSRDSLEYSFLPAAEKTNALRELEHRFAEFERR
jgi:adenosine deaminase